MQYQEYTPLQNMMVNIVAEGERDVWDSIEAIKEPFKRFAQRQIYFKALLKLKETP